MDDRLQQSLSSVAAGSTDDEDGRTFLHDLSDFVVSDEELELDHHHPHMSQTSLGTANTDANHTQTLLMQLQQQEDTSTSFVPSLMGGEEEDDNTQEDLITEVPLCCHDDEEELFDEDDGNKTDGKQRTTTPRNSDVAGSSSLFRYLRSLTGAKAAAAEDSSSSSENQELYSSSSSSSWSCDQEDNNNNNNNTHQNVAVVDWTQLPALPNRFCNTKLRTPHYLDASLILQDGDAISKADANAFVSEHGTLLRAVLQLLAERDQVGVEGSIVATDNIWKKGSLKKLAALGLRSAGTWKVKYVEIRQGNLCYYGDSGNGQRKIIHLRQADAVVQESSLRGPGLVWELNVQGTKYYWSASSEAERQSWMKAMQNAMIGDEGPRRELDLQPYQSHIVVYQELRNAVQRAESQKEYLAAIQNAIKELASLQLPVQWVREQTERELSPVLLGTLKPPRFNTSPQKRLRSSIAEFWRTMGQTTFTINGLTVPRSSQLASERIVGALTRCILEYDKASVDAEERDEEGGGTANVLISELQSVSYARDILLSVLRSRERQDIACAVKYLLDNSFVTVESTTPIDEPVHMEVSFAGEDLPDTLPESEEMACWVWTRTRRNNIRVWKQRQSYAVLSGTVLSLYEAAEPRPHGLRGQVVLDSNMTVKEYGEDLNEADSIHSKSSKARYGLCITTGRSLDRLLYFDKAEDAAAWKDAIGEAIQNADSIQKPPRVVTTATTLSAHATLLKGAERVIMGAADGTLQTGVRVIRGAKDGGIRVIRGATGSGMRVIKTATGAGFKVVRGAVDRLRQSKNAGDDGEAADESSQRNSDGSRRPSLDILLNNTIVHGKREPTVQCVIRSTETFSIKNQGFTEHSSERETDFTGTSTAEAWMSVEARLYQAFLMCGGPSGRIALGDALVELHFVETSVEQDDEGSC